MSTTHSQVTVQGPEIPRRVVISAWAVPVMVLGQFSFFAAIPVAVIVVAVLRRVRTRATRWWAIALGALYATPLAIWALRPDRAPSLSKDMSPAFVVLIVAAAIGVIVSAHRTRTRTALS